MDIGPAIRRSALLASIAAGLALSGCEAPYLHFDLARAEVFGDRRGVRPQISALVLEAGGPGVPSKQALTFAVIPRAEFRTDWARMQVAGQLRLTAFRWLWPCGHAPACDVLVSAWNTPKESPFRTVVAGKGGRPVDMLYIGKNNEELFTLGAFLEGDLGWSGPFVPAATPKTPAQNGASPSAGDSSTPRRDKNDMDWKSSLDRPIAMGGLFATVTPPLFFDGLIRIGVETGAEYDGVDPGLFGRVTLGFGITNAPSPPRVEDVPPPYVRKK